MKLTSVSVLIAHAAFLLCSATMADNYDYFTNVRYPGERRPDVGSDRVQESSNTRIVHWWPKKGVDIVDVPAGVELRTWHIRTAAIEPLVEAGVFTKWWPQDLRGTNQFKAHLIGFRGVGASADIPFFDKGRIRVQGRGHCPAVVLRLEDGRKRCFTRGAFTDDDQAYILALYDQGMARIRGQIEPPPSQIPPDIEARYPLSELYKPGTYRVQSERFVISSGSEEAGDGIPGVWINQAREQDSAQHRSATLRVFEDYWAYNEYAGHLMPFWEKPVQYKYSVVYGGTKVNGFEIIGRGNGGGYGGCGTACWEGLYHEWGHGFASDPIGLLGGAETRCDALQTMADPSLVRKVSFQINRPYKNLFWGQYPGGLGYAMVADDPNWGYGAVSSFPCLASEIENTPMHIIARLGQERAIWDNGIKGMGDFMAQIGARMAEYDCELEGMLREAYPAPNRSCLVAVDRAQGLYRSTRTEAPEPFGVNIIRLIPESGAKVIAVDFQGMHDPDTYSDWRACIVAVGANGRPRYSPLWNKGEYRMDMCAGDKRFWLTVTATPYALVAGREGGGGSINHVYQGGFAYKYPYEVKLTGCRPGSPHAPIGVNENMNLVGPTLFARADAGFENAGQGDWPHPADSPEYAEMKKALEAQVAIAPVMIKRYMVDEVLTDAPFCPIANRPINRQTALASAVFLEWRAKWLLDNAQGARHPHGGGWVATSAKVAPTAYVGPDCMVLDGAQVLDNAIIEDYAIVSGPKVLVKDHARIHGKAVVCGDVTLTDYARVCRSIFNRASRIEWNMTDPTAPPYKFQMTTGVPVVRNGPEERVEVFKDRGLTLQANYAFDRAETMLLEDWFQEHSVGAFAFGAHSTDLIFYDGVLYGNPGFVKDGDTRAFTFNGVDQYAEADPAVADLGAITVDMRVKPELGTLQTLFDFGSSLSNRFMLLVVPSGEPVIVIVRDGVEQKTAGNKPVPAGQWSSCRVEIDGKNARLWLNNEKIGEAATTFRPADAFPAGIDKRNFIAATREQKNMYKGAIDHMRIHFAVYDDFTNVPEPPMVSSRRIDPEFVARFDKKHGNYEAELGKYKDTVKHDKMYQFYEQWNKRVDDRIAELGNSDEVKAAERRIRELQAQIELRRNEVATLFDNLPANIEKRKQFDDIERRRQELFRECLKTNTAYTALQKEEEDARRQREEVEQAVRKTREADIKANNEKRGECEKRRNAFLDAVASADPVLVTNRISFSQVTNELRMLDPKTSQTRIDALRGQERQLSDELWRRRDALARDNPDWRVLEQEIGAINEKEWAIIRETASADPRYEQAASKEMASRQKREAVERAVWSTPALAALEREREKYVTWSARDAYVTKGIAPLNLEMNQLMGKVKDMRVEAGLANNPDEYQALVSLGGGKDQYKQAIEDRMKIKLMPAMPEDAQQLHQALPYQAEPWHTQVDWDGRTPWEASGEPLSPTMQRWLKRMKPYQYK